MNTSAPIHVLKREARRLARSEHIPLHQALDRVARREGFPRWSLLVHRAAAAETGVQLPMDPLSAEAGARLLAGLHAGDLLLIAARPRQGKTVLGLALAVAVMRAGGQGAFFTLDYTRADMARCFERLGERWSHFDSRFHFDDSDAIDADYVIDRTAQAAPGTVVVIDYLQLLDQRRSSPEVAVQVRRLRDHARARHLIVACIAQIDRRYDAGAGGFPGWDDVRRANPLDLSLFDKACFLNGGQARLARTG